MGRTPVTLSRSKRSLGQNFLIDPNIAAKIVSALEPLPGEGVLEIGPGQGALTGQLLERRLQPMVLELDWVLAWALKQRWPELVVVSGDGKLFPFGRLAQGEIRKVVGNLPYNVASVIMWNFAADCRGIDRAVFMIQKEVAQRLTAKPGGRDYGMLSAWMQSFLDTRLLFHVSPTVFRPRPKVMSSVVCLRPKVNDLAAGCTRDALRATLHLCFQHRRKQMGTILKAYWDQDIESWFTWGERCRTMRPEELSALEFQEMAAILDSRLK